MKNTLVTMLILTMILSCENDAKTDHVKDKSASAKTTNSHINSGNFKATLGDTTYDISVKCLYLNEDYFIFDSDARGGTEDTNGDGIIVSGNQDGKKLSLIIVDNGKSYSAGNISISKSNNIASGTGTLFLQSGSEQSKVTYKVTCN